MSTKCQCIAEGTGKSCKRNAQANSKFCWQHSKKCKNPSQEIKKTKEKLPPKRKDAHEKQLAYIQNILDKEQERNDRYNERNNYEKSDLNSFTLNAVTTNEKLAKKMQNEKFESFAPNGSMGWGFGGGKTEAHISGVKGAEQLLDILWKITVYLKLELDLDNLKSDKGVIGNLIYSLD